MSDAEQAFTRAYAGGPERHHRKSEEQGKLPVRERVARLLDAGSLCEDALLANWDAEGLGADGVVTGMGTIGGRTVALMANDPTVKAGSWGPKTVEKILRIQETALAHRVPMVYLVDSAGARITEQVQMFPGRRHAGRIFFNEVKLSGSVPQVCVLFGPSAAGGAYIPAFCDVVIMRDGNASMYLGSPRMAEMVIGEQVSLEEMGGARMHTGVSGCGHFLVKTDAEGIELAKRYLAYFPSHWEEAPPPTAPAPPTAAAKPIRELIPADENKPWDMRELLDALVDLQERALVDESGEQLAHVPRLVLVRGDQRADRRGVRRRGRGRRGRGILPPVRREVREVALGEVDPVLVALDEEVAAAGHAGVHLGSAHLLQRDVLADHHLGHAR